MNSGLGKSLQAITIARYKKLHQGLKHCLIVCGVNSLKYNWQREISKFCKDERGIILGTRYGKTDKTRDKLLPLTVKETIEQVESCPEEFFWIINIEKMRCTQKEFKKGKTIINAFNKLIEKKELGLMILDEAHVVKKVTSQNALRYFELVTRYGKITYDWYYIGK